MITQGSYILYALLVSTLFAGCAGLFTGIFQAFGKGLQSTIMSVARGVISIPIIILGNKWFHLNGVIWSVTISEIFSCFVGLCLLIGLNRKEKK